MILILLCVFTAFAAFFIVNYFLGSFERIETESKVHNVTVKGKKSGIIMPVVLRWADAIGLLLSALKIKKLDGYMSALQKDFDALGGEYKKYNPYQYLVLQFFAMFAGVFFTAVFITTGGLLLFLSGCLFFSLPFIKLKENVKKRKEQVFKQLPDMADLLSVMMEAGSDFFGAAEKVTDILKGPLSDEFNDALSKISLGYDKKAAFNEMIEKSGVEQLGFFIRTINMALEAGVGMSDTLKRLASQMRMERAMAAEKKAQEAPVKMLIPLVLFIFPTIFIVIFGPIVINFIKTGGL